MIIGVIGKAGAGKDTIADYFVNQHGFKRIALADPIKRMVEDVFVLDKHTVYDRVAREQPLPQWNGWSVRKLLQIIGTELFRRNIDDSVWVKSLLLRVQADPSHNYVVPDVRFPNELNYLAENCKDFFSIKVYRSGFDGTVGVAKHESEAYDLPTQYIVKNDGTIEDLHQDVSTIYGEHMLSQCRRPL